MSAVHQPGPLRSRQRLDGNVAEPPGGSRSGARWNAGRDARLPRRARRELAVVPAVGGDAGRAAFTPDFAADSRRGFLSVGAEGLLFAWRDPVIRLVVVALFLGVAFAAVDNVALVFLVRETLGGGPIAFGLVSGAYGAGMIAGSIGLSWRGSAIASGTLFLLGWLASGAGTLLTGLAPLLLIVALAQAVAGIGNAVENIAGDTLIQRLVPRPMLGRVFGLVSTAAFGGSTLAYAAGGIALDLTSPRTPFVIGGAGVLGVALFLAVALRRTLAGPGTTGATPPEAPS